LLICRANAFILYKYKFSNFVVREVVSYSPSHVVIIEI
jgi:hypothetical protein